MTIVITMKEPNPDWNNLNCKIYDDITYCQTVLGKFQMYHINIQTNSTIIELDKIDNIMIVP